MAEYIEKEPLLTAFKEKNCKGCHGGYDKEKCGGRCGAPSEDTVRDWLEHPQSDLKV